MLFTSTPLFILYYTVYKPQRFPFQSTAASHPCFLTPHYCFLIPYASTVQL
ncbi:hypothetical protein Hanom_Chr11g01024521 [Helianthus anomalus]